MENLQKIKKQSKFAYFMTIAISVSFLIAFPTIILLLIGIGLDNYFHKSPFFTLSGATLGFLSSFINIYKLLKKLT